MPFQNDRWSPFKPQVYFSTSCDETVPLIIAGSCWWRVRMPGWWAGTRWTTTSPGAVSASKIICIDCPFNLFFLFAGLFNDRRTSPATSGQWVKSMCTVYTRVEWFATFWDFRKWKHCCGSGIFVWAQFQKSANSPRAHGKVYIFQKSKWIFNNKICKYRPFASKNTRQKKSSKLKNLKHFILGPQKKPNILD